MPDLTRHPEAFEKTGFWLQFIPIKIGAGMTAFMKTVVFGQTLINRYAGELTQNYHQYWVERNFIEKEDIYGQAQIFLKVGSRVFIIDLGSHGHTRLLRGVSGGVSGAGSHKAGLRQCAHRPGIDWRILDKTGV